MKPIPSPEDVKNLEIFLLKHHAKALEILFDLYGSVLYGIAYRFVKNEDKAEKLIQQTLLEFVNNYSEKENAGQTLQLRLINAVRNNAQLKITSSESNQSRFFNVGTFKEMTPSENAPLFKIPGNNGSLNSEQNTILELVFFSGRNISDVSNQLGVEPAKVKSLLREALKNYRKESETLSWK